MTGDNAIDDEPRKCLVDPFDADNLDSLDLLRDGFLALMSSPASSSTLLKVVASSIEPDTGAKDDGEYDLDLTREFACDGSVLRVASAPSKIGNRGACSTSRSADEWVDGTVTVSVITVLIKWHKRRIELGRWY